jgi:hypothetical protein
VRSKLSADEVQRYRQDGFVVPELKLPEPEFTRMKDVCENIIRDNVGKPDLIRQVAMPRLPGLPQDEGNEYGTTLFELCLSPSILDPVEQLLGPDIVLFYTFMIAKPPGDGWGVSWHQDAFYSPLRPQNGLSVWIALDDVGPDNGCMHCVPQSKGQGLVPHSFDDRPKFTPPHNIDERHFDPETAVDIVLKPGQFSLHDVYTIHGSNPNRSSRRRAGFIIDYAAASSHYDRGTEAKGARESRAAAAHAKWPIWVVRGENRNPLNDFEMGHAGLDAYDELALSARRSGRGTA